MCSRDIYGLHFNRHYENKLSGKAIFQVASTGSATGAAAELGSLGNLGCIENLGSGGWEGMVLPIQASTEVGAVKRRRGLKRLYESINEKFKIQLK